MATLLITGSDGFIGKNLIVALKRLNKHTIRAFDTNVPPSELPAMLSDADFVFHLAGINRPTDESEFKKGNTDLTQFIVNTLLTQKRNTPIVLTSSTQAASDNPASNIRAPKSTSSTGVSRSSTFTTAHPTDAVPKSIPNT